jgi:hypothetical protein
MLPPLKENRERFQSKWLLEPPGLDSVLRRVHHPLQIPQTGKHWKRFQS